MTNQNKTMNKRFPQIIIPQGKLVTNQNTLTGINNAVLIIPQGKLVTNQNYTRTACMAQLIIPQGKLVTNQNQSHLRNNFPHHYTTGKISDQPEPTPNLRPLSKDYTV